MHPLEFDELCYVIMERGTEWKHTEENELRETIRAFINETGAAELTETQNEEITQIYHNLKGA